MSRLSLRITMPVLNLNFTRTIFSLFQSSNHYSHTRSHAHFSINIFSSSLKMGISNSSEFTPCFSTLAVSAFSGSSSRTKVKSSSDSTSRSAKKARREAPESVLKRKLDMCSKHNDLQQALQIYDDAKANGIHLSAHHYDVLLYLCSVSANAGDGTGGHNSGESNSSEGLETGFEIFRQMRIDKVAPNEATFTSLARVAAAKKDPEMAFDLVIQMKSSGITPKLRSYGPALFGFCKNGDADRAYDVYAHMMECGVAAEEPELSALLKVSADAMRADRVYEMLHQLRASVRQVSEETAKIVEDWFASETAAEIGLDNWDVDKVKEGIIRCGGGWHGQGWLGSGRWSVVKAEMDENGVCSSCGEKLVCIDIDPKETEDFASSLSSLACQKEKKNNFLQFQEWLQKHGPFDSIVDGANVGLINTHKFSFRQLNDVVNKLQRLSPSKKLPLVVLHRGRIYGGPAENPNNRRLLESWKNSGALFATPPGSNDDWYWLYAAVSCKCLMITNDEMRDHLFQLLGNSIFPRWKEKHQVRMTVSRNGLALHMPPPYSIVIQESEQGSWHVPTVTGDDLETPRQWLCATRAKRTSSRMRPSLPQLFSAS